MGWWVPRPVNPIPKIMSPKFPVSCEYSQYLAVCTYLYCIICIYNIFHPYKGCGSKNIFYILLAPEHQIFKIIVFKP